VSLCIRQNWHCDARFWGYRDCTGLGMRNAVVYKPDSDPADQFVRRKAIDECAARFSLQEQRLQGQRYHKHDDRSIKHADDDHGRRGAAALG
jgi:hypothetical protein